MNSPADIRSFSPSSLRHLTGQAHVIRQVQVALDACQQDARKFDHSLLVGSPGLGKSALASIIAREMAAGYHEILGQSLTSLVELNGLLLAAKNRDVLFIDEAHELRKTLQTHLYLALDRQCVFVKTGNSSTPIGIPIADCTLLLATTDEFCLLQPLRDRMKLVLRYQFYSQDELVQILQIRCKGLNWSVEEAILPLIAARSRGTPRLALRLLQASHRVCRSLGETTITLDHLHQACELEQLDDAGLGPDEQAYMRILAATPSRLNVIASTLALPTRTVSVVIEAFLIRAGLITKDHQGVRTLTAKGREHLSKNRPATA